jgi:hypothetical protein
MYRNCQLKGHSKNSSHVEVIAQIWPCMNIKRGQLTNIKENNISPGESKQTV